MKVPKILARLLDSAHENVNHSLGRTSPNTASSTAYTASATLDPLPIPVMHLADPEPVTFLPALGKLIHDIHASLGSGTQYTLYSMSISASEGMV